MIVNVIDQQSSLKISVEQVTSLVEDVIREENQTCDVVNIYFVDIQTICDLHQQFFDDPSPTDCISFPMDNEEDEAHLERILGDVFVCPEVAVAFAEENKLDCYEELSLYVIHGLLHLMGYDDLDDDECQIMRKAESRHLDHLKRSARLLKPELDF